MAATPFTGKNLHMFAQIKQRIKVNNQQNAARKSKTKTTMNVIK